MNAIKKILILSANPRDTARLRLDEEVREIEERLRRSKYRELFSINSRLAVTTKDFQQAMLDYDPHIVHFCGHGEQDGLIIENINGEAASLNSDALVELFAFSGKVECVILNACYSLEQAKAINKSIPCVIGMKKGIQDQTAIEFSVGFYNALGAGKNYQEAFKFGCIAIKFYNIPEELNPVIFPEMESDRLKFRQQEAKEGLMLREDTFAVGIDVGLANFSRGVVCFPADNANPPEIKRNLPREKWNSQNDAFILVDKIADCIEQTVRDSYVEPRKISRIGIGLPGQVNPDTGQLLNAPGLDLQGIEIADNIKQALLTKSPTEWPTDLQVLIDNDVTCMTLAENSIGEGKRVKNLVCIAIGKGIGAGVIANGELYTGYNFNAGEVGHVTMDLSENARECLCGSRGCFEAYCSERGVVKTAIKYISIAKEKNPESILAKLSADENKLKAKDISALMKLNDKSVAILRDELARHFAIGLSNISNNFNPEVIVVTGGIGLGFFEHLAFQNRVHKYIEVYTLAACMSTIRCSSIKEDAPIIGAAMLGVGAQI